MTSVIVVEKPVMKSAAAKSGNSQQKRTAILAGATGLVGGELLKLLNASSEFNAIHCLGRRVPLLKSEKIFFHQTDFSNLSGLKLPEAEVLFCCLGTTIKQAGSQEQFYRVDHDYVLALGRLAQSKKIRRMLVVTAIGADANSRIFYNRVKGETERDLKKLSLPALVIARPALLTGERREHRLGEGLAAPIMALVNPLLQGPLKNYRSIPAAQVAAALMSLSRQEPALDVRIVESAELADIAELTQY